MSNLLYLLFLFSLQLTKDPILINKYLKNLDILEVYPKNSWFDFLKDVINFEKSDPYRYVQAPTRLSNRICSQEASYLRKRFITTKKAIENLVQKELTAATVPRIALCFSGGGYRAMIVTLSSLIALEKAGLLDTVTYIATLSGSTWSTASWFGHDLSLQELKSLTQQQISKPIQSGFDLKLLIENGIWKILYGQKLTLVSIWGIMLANILFGDLEARSKILPKNNIAKTKIDRGLLKSEIPRLSQCANCISEGQKPMPIYTSVIVNNKYEWLEFTPYEIGSGQEKIFIPSWSFGREFESGVSINYAPEHGLDFYMGIWGSAFTASLGELLEMYGKSMPPFIFQTLDTVVVQNGSLSGLRISPAKIRNIAYLLPDHPWKDNKFMTLVDAGLDFNLPLPPLLRKERNIDIIITIDGSATTEGAPELKAAEQYAVKNNIKFPKINYENIETKNISIFESDNLNTPTVIYIPFIKNKEYSEVFDPTECIKNEYCSTFNLVYTPEQFDMISDLAEYNILSSANKIIETIKLISEKKLEATS